VTDITIANVSYRLTTEQRDGQWIARAQRTGTGDRFGPECSGATAAEAMSRLTAWLEWQSEHAAALEALQQAEQIYHRTIAGSAFASPAEGPSAVEMQRDALDQVEAARVRLDEIRARKPD
jgi:hypothetical protein